MAPNTSIAEFHSLLDTIMNKSRSGRGRQGRILAILGAGLSAPSGLPTMRGPGGLWQRTMAADSGSTVQTDLETVWLYYAWRHHLIPRASPNAAHEALARLAEISHPPPTSSNEAMAPVAMGEGEPVSAPPRHTFDFMCLTLNTDGLSERAGHPSESLRTAFGCNMAHVCTNSPACPSIQRASTSDRPCPLLVSAGEDAPPWLTDPTAPVPKIEASQLPRCPSCNRCLLRPAIQPNRQGLADIDEFVGGPPTVDVTLLVGTAGVVPPVTRYLHETKRLGAVVAVVNPDPSTAEGLRDDDFFFKGSAAEYLPRLFEKIIVDPRQVRLGNDEQPHIGLPS